MHTYKHEHAFFTIAVGSQEPVMLNATLKQHH